MEKKLIDFTKVEIADIEGNKTAFDVSKVVGNCIYGQTPDIGMMDLAREVYHKGKVEMTIQEIDYFKRILVATDMITAALKVALKELLNY